MAQLMRYLIRKLYVIGKRACYVYTILIAISDRRIIQTSAKQELYSAIQNRAVKYDSPEDAKAYLERMVNLENIDPEDAAFIYQVYVGGTAADFVPEGDFPTTFEEFYEMTGSDASIMKKSEFERAKASGNSRVSEYTDYYDYLAKMYDKYKN